MAPAALVCSGCGLALRASPGHRRQTGICPLCRPAVEFAARAFRFSGPSRRTWLSLAAIAAMVSLALECLHASREIISRSERPTASEHWFRGIPGVPTKHKAGIAAVAKPPQPSRDEEVIASKDRAVEKRPSPLPPPANLATNPPASCQAIMQAGEPRRVRIGDDRGRPQVARVYGGDDSPVVMMPDGRIGWPNAMVYTDEPFRPHTAEQIRDDLLSGPYEGFKVTQTGHYLIFYEGSTPFAQDSGKLLESLYLGLSKSLREKGIDVKESEFPLVAVIFKTEADFRAHKQIDPDIRAYYEILSNRIFFYEIAAGDREPSEVAAMRRPQTVAHEGTHQILNNIGVQPRLAQWPLWLVEGLAEFCAPTETRNGEWAGFNKVNPFHMATMHDLEDTTAIQGRNVQLTNQRIGRRLDHSMVEDLVTRERLTPTDYALSWALTHYLANKRFDAFVAYLKKLGKMPPLVDQTPEQHLRMFRAAFAADLATMDHSIHNHLGKLTFEPVPFYAVVFEQPIGQSFFKRGTLVSQSPQVIRQWIDEMQAEHPRPYVWHVNAFQSRKKATQAVEEWAQGR